MARSHRYNRTPWLARVIGWLLANLLLAITWPIRWPFRRRRENRMAEQEAVRLARAAAAANGQPAPGSPTEHRFRTRLWRNRKPLHPIWVAAALALFTFTIPAGPLGAQVIGWTGVLVLALLWVARVTDTHRGWALLTVVIGLAWAFAPHFSRVTPLTLLAVTAAAVTARARHFRHRPPPPPPARTELEAVWEDVIAVGSGPLPGTRITPAGQPDEGGRHTWDHNDPETGERLGVRVCVHLVRGKQTSKHVRAAAPLIASACGVEAGQVLPGRWEGDEGRAELIVLDGATSLRAALAGVVPWVPTLKAGSYVHGRRVDGRSSLVQLYDEQEGGRPVWLSGQMSTGKSVSTDTILSEVTYARVCAVIIIDMKPGGRSLPDWEPVCLPLADGRPAYITDPGEALRVLRRIRVWAEHRGQVMKQLTGPAGGAVRCMAPSVETPGLVVVCEEGPELFKRVPDAVAEWQWIVRMTRAFGVIPVFTGQPTTVAAAFGGDGAIRDAHQQSTMIIHRNSEAAGKRTAGSALPLDPNTLPWVAGAGWVLSGAEDPDDTVMRAAWNPTPHITAQLGPVRLPAGEEAILGTDPEVEESATVTRLPVRGKTEQLRADIVEWIVDQAEPVRTSAVYKTFADRASQDAVDRALKNAAGEETIFDAGRGLWASPEPQVATR